MKTTSTCLGHTPPEAMWGNDSMEDGFYPFHQHLSPPPVQLGYFPKAAPWEMNLDDFGYYSINGGIARALKKMAGHS